MGCNRGICSNMREKGDCLRSREYLNPSFHPRPHPSFPKGLRGRVSLPFVQSSHAHDLSHLQGEDTEQDAVLQLVVALRTAKKVQLHITNYRKDGSPFTNFLSLHPVHDWRGAYRYAIAILVDASLATQEDRNMIERLRRLFPGRLDVELQPIKYAEALGATMPAEWLERQRHAMQRNFALLLWLEDPCFALTVLARDEELLSIFNMELRSAGRQVEGGGRSGGVGERWRCYVRVILAG